MTIQLDDQDIHELHYDQIKQVLKDEPFASFLGMKLTKLGPGTAEAELIPDDRMLNSHGTVHGAIIFSLADYVFAAASNSYGKIAVGVTTNVNFISAGKRGETLTANAKEIKKNHKLAWYKIEVLNEKELIATMEAMVYRKNHYFVQQDE
ncbi:PaaI family thioesterase [Peribacillus butanolivorans]|uniref:PaaI family thioesterase n=1 Tax=Peribacillus TaxID=2675229 RepID=UPI0019117264|nr:MULTISPECIES: hotdog fold thioesterase [unclassified Peribacillus]MBK5445254.1 hotdog fold thioesterase [Peribacillus sp. TH24]MBK5460021.1 hotdog fold thioesterase [Peribacillus sp. TH27]MBK5481834.1 hotdog fold thioesterase [Peribacillus sp. TH16]MBK5498212.1 hotdog fold thioesterase [Peribacillus sp. TH14]WMX56669.1 hotdog fold thioesterase [Peribacillus sp. R9-11]